jgi:hypothetical protein
MRDSWNLRRRPHRPRLWWVVSGLVATSALLLAAPASMAISYAPPYAHVQEAKYDWLRTTSGCASQKSTIPSFDPRTGNESWKGKVSVGACASAFRKALTDNVAEAEGATELSIPVRPPAGTATPATFTVTWNLTASGNIGLSLKSGCLDPMPAGTSGSYECVATALSELIGNAWLVDLTNGTVTAASNSPVTSGIGTEQLNYTFCSPNCASFTFAFTTGAAFSGPQSDSFTINATLDHTHRYAIVTYLGGWAAAELDGYAGHASAYVNLATGGNGAQLVSVVES